MSSVPGLPQILTPPSARDYRQGDEVEIRILDMVKRVKVVAVKQHADGSFTLTVESSDG